MGGLKRRNGHHHMSAPIPSPGWHASHAREIPVELPVNLRMRGLLGEVTQLSWAPKTSADCQDYSLDPHPNTYGPFDFLRQILSVTVITATGGAFDMKPLWSTIIDGKPVIFLGGGEPGSIQTVEIVMATQRGRRINSSVQIAVRADGPATLPVTVPTMTSGVPIPPNAIQLPDGNILVDEDGNPYLIA